jgi:hypothetical protein
MKRRNFMGGLAALMCGAVAGCKCLAESKVEPDPFTKIYLSKGQTVHYKTHSFTQKDDYTIIYTKDYFKNTDWYYGHYQSIPIDFKDKQFSKKEFVKKCEEFYKLTLNPYVADYELLEFICDNGKSNLFAIHYRKDNK